MLVCRCKDLHTVKRWHQVVIFYTILCFSSPLYHLDAKYRFTNQSMHMYLELSLIAGSSDRKGLIVVETITRKGVL